MKKNFTVVGRRTLRKFRQAGLGLLIGKRSWGGVVSISNRSLIEGSGVSMPKFDMLNSKGEWIIEDYGITRTSKSTRN